MAQRDEESNNPQGDATPDFYFFIKKRETSQDIDYLIESQTRKISPHEVIVILESWIAETRDRIRKLLFGDSS